MCVPRTFGVTQARGEGGDVLRGASMWAGGTRQAVLNAGGSFHGLTMPEQGVKPGDAEGKKIESGSGLKRRGWGSIHAQHQGREGTRPPAQAGGARGCPGLSSLPLFSPLLEACFSHQDRIMSR